MIDSFVKQNKIKRKKGRDEESTKGDKGRKT